MLHYLKFIYFFVVVMKKFVVTIVCYSILITLFIIHFFSLLAQNFDLISFLFIKIIYQIFQVFIVFIIVKVMFFAIMKVIVN